MNMMITDYRQIVEFHGHKVMDVLNKSRAEDEELAAIVENDACGVDALQCLSGCTFGKGNLLFGDDGKHVYTLYRRSSRKGVRVSLKVQDIPQSLKEDHEQFTQWLLGSPQAEFLSVEAVDGFFQLGKIAGHSPHVIMHVTDTVDGRLDRKGARKPAAARPYDPESGAWSSRSPSVPGRLSVCG
jgi:formylmethanofuran dehydrogenase subunit E